jgi:hypothetical protein
MRLQANKHWKTLELKLSDAGNEAKDNVRYLATLEKSFEVWTMPSRLPHHSSCYVGGAASVVFHVPLACMTG